MYSEPINTSKSYFKASLFLLYLKQKKEVEKIFHQFLGIAYNQGKYFARYLAGFFIFFKNYKKKIIIRSKKSGYWIFHGLVLQLTRAIKVFLLK
jgi:hypothetical protein